MDARQYGPTLRAQWLGQQLRELREQAGFKMSEAAEFLQRSQAWMSRFETADYPIRRGELLGLMTLYGIADEGKRQELIDLSDEVWRKGWWDGYAEHVDRVLMDYAWLEDRATAIRSLDLLAFPGLLQTPEYASALITEIEHDALPNQIEQWTDLRIARQSILNRDEPPHITSLVDEALLHRPVGGVEVTRTQLKQLLVMAEQPYINIRILPLGIGAHAGSQGAFAIVELPTPYPAVTYAETPAGAIYVEAPYTERFLRRYDRLYERALEVEESMTMIAAAVEELG